MNKVMIKNVSSATVSLFVPEMKFNRELIPGRSIPVERDVYDELTFDPGFNTLIRNHYISISGLENDEAVEITENVYDVEAITKLLDNIDVTTFAKFIATAKPAEQETVVHLAVEKGITHPAIVELIKKYCNQDIIALIGMKHAAEE